MISGIWIPLVTPFRRGSVDIDALQYLADHYLRQGVDGFVALGTTAEAALLSDVERAAVVQALVSVVGGRAPIVIGVGGPDTREVLREIGRYERWACAGYLVSPPSYICPDQAGVRWHFEQVARATERAIVLYNVPHRTGVTIEPDTVARIVEHGNVVAIKECVKEHFARLGTLPLSLLCGTDEAFVDCLSAGGSGGILASAHVCADLLADARHLVETGARADARKLFACLIPLLRLLFSAPNPSAIKAMLSLDHPVSCETRMPIGAASPELIERLRKAREHLQDVRAEFVRTVH
ncbi:4-hydroxy-tetrahydrodipicolinate synthase family protein [Burkholderia alba]|uniref:4-hydroxy-tetrahydrodipicolinate synthase family protein n=1 Tax=Burkholderia alba TaxID=2683677 RepID=UPI002B058C79|nr:4-hydroxy-tetrahydrodipicolinate synthase [Burkholderia alba]